MERKIDSVERRVVLGEELALGPEPTSGRPLAGALVADQRTTRTAPGESHYFLRPLPFPPPPLLLVIVTTAELDHPEAPASLTLRTRCGA